MKATPNQIQSAPSSGPTPPESRAARILREVFESGRPLTFVHTSEEQRAGSVLREAALRLFSPTQVPVWTWSLTHGLHRDGAHAEAGTQDPQQALEFIAAHKQPAIFHLKDFHEALRDSPAIRRHLRDLYESCRGKRKFVVITAPVRAIPEELERNLLYLELRPPDIVEITEFLRRESGQTDMEILQPLASALLGLTLDEAQYAISRALAEHGSLTLEARPALLEEKRLLINRTGYLEFMSDGTKIGEVGGLEGIKKWLLERRKLFQMREDLSAELVPKGVLIMGIPGCGKSLSVKAISSYLQLPLYRIDMIEIFSGRYGKPEGAFVQACKMMEDMAPAVLWFDEIEMGITSTDSGGEQGRIFAFFLTWMQEKTRGLFVAATANRIDLLPAEMIRKGRFDEVFFVDLPLDEERVEIFQIHLARRGVDLSGIDLEQLKSFTTGWTGAEIEQCVISAILKARLAEQPVTGKDLINVAVKTVPLSRTMSEQIDHIRSWAF